ncbi:MAG TPA: carboxypeptidase-like regulatory domain-containing protein, partial [Iamia sp.]|nr:carboxypeptidase-like regulatory domain-containing protein [Iamia sp.]
ATSGTFVRSARTDADGGYRIPSLPAGVYRLAFRDPSGAHVTTWDRNGDGDVIGGLPPYVPANGTMTFDKELELTSTLAGIVTDGDAPLAGIRVALYREGAAVRNLTTAADGTWSASLLEPGSYTVGYSDPSRTFVAEYHQDRARLADADEIDLEPLHGTDVQAVLARR